jgi:glycosyltransferase involved in cell wall biosynthesis
VSVVIPFLNDAQFLPEAIAAVMGQTYRDWELLLVDDGSRDYSTALARDYAVQMPDRVFYLDHPGHENRGISASRNLGILHARGTYVAFLDSDDVWPATKLEEQVHILEAHPEVDLLYGTALVWYSWDETSSEVNRDYIADMRMPLEQVTPGLLLLTRSLRREVPSPSPSNILVRRTAALEIGLFEEEFRGMHEDQVFLAKLCLRSRIFVSGNCWQKYRKHSGSCRAQVSKAARTAARGRYLKWLRTYLAQAGEQGGEVWTTVEEQLRPYRLAGRVRSRAIRVARQVLPATIRSRLRKWLGTPDFPRRTVE